MNLMRVWRRYQIVSTRGTQGTVLQRLLVFTTMRRKAPAGAIDSALRRYDIDVRVLMRPDLQRMHRGSRRLSGGGSASP